MNNTNKYVDGLNEKSGQLNLSILYSDSKKNLEIIKELYGKSKLTIPEQGLLNIAEKNLESRLNHILDSSIPKEEKAIFSDVLVEYSLFYDTLFTKVEAYKKSLTNKLHESNEQSNEQQKPFCAQMNRYSTRKSVVDSVSRIISRANNSLDDQARRILLENLNFSPFREYRAESFDSSKPSNPSSPSDQELLIKDSDLLDCDVLMQK